MNDVIEYIFYLILFFQFTLSLYLPNTKIEWVVMSTLLITMILTSGLFFKFAGDSNTPHMFHTQLTPLMEVIVKIITNTIYKVIQPIYDKVTGRSLPLPTFILSIMCLLVPVILIITSTAIVTNFRKQDNTRAMDKRIKIYKSVLMANIIIVTLIIVGMINQNNIEIIIGGKIKTNIIYILTGVTVSTLVGSSIWMIYEALELMRQYRKSK